MKKVFYSEAAYVLGLLTLAVGTALMERADFGMSMVVAPAYLVYFKVSQYYSWFTFGMAEYCFQAFLILVLSLILHRFKRTYVFSFITAVIYGFLLDAVMCMVGIIPVGGMVQRVLFYVLGLVICASGVALLFHTYITPEAYELFVKEVSGKMNKEIHTVKTVYDCCSCFIAVLMSFVFAGFPVFVGVKAGTILCALVNGWMIGRCADWLEKNCSFKDAFALRRYFE